MVMRMVLMMMLKVSLIKEVTMAVMVELTLMITRKIKINLLVINNGWYDDAETQRNE